MRVLKLIDEHPDDPDFHEEFRRHEQWLLGMGEGRLSPPEGHVHLIEIPDHMAKACREDGIDVIFGNPASNIGDKEYFKSRAILAADNVVPLKTQSDY